MTTLALPFTLPGYMDIRAFLARTPVDPQDERALYRAYKSSMRRKGITPEDLDTFLQVAAEPRIDLNLAYWHTNIRTRLTWAEPVRKNEVQSACWILPDRKVEKYPNVTVPGRRKSLSLHRFAAMTSCRVNSVARTDGRHPLNLRHKCDNPLCGRPSHLEHCTYSRNLHDRGGWFSRCTADEILAMYDAVGTYEGAGEALGITGGTVHYYVNKRRADMDAQPNRAVILRPTDWIGGPR